MSPGDLLGGGRPGAVSDDELVQSEPCRAWGACDGGWGEMPKAWAGQRRPGRGGRWSRRCPHGVAEAGQGKGTAGEESVGRDFRRTRT